MIKIGIIFAKRLAIALGIDIDSIENEYLLPYGCKLVNYQSNWYIKHYAYDQSDWKQLCNQFSFLQIADQPLSNRYFS
jgi:hypothetical protein